MTDSDDKVNVLTECLGKAKDLSGLIDYAKNSIVSKTIVDKSAGTITLFAFDAGQGLSEHTTPYNTMVLVLDGSAKLTIGGNQEVVTSGQIIIMPANVLHSVTAEESFKMLLVMIRS